jgi:hypothetical protein
LYVLWISEIVLVGYQRIVDELNVETGGGLEDFRYYLKRHIGLDGEEHGPLASRLILSLRGSDEARWQAAEQAAVQSLETRGDLWDAMYALIRQQKDRADGNIGEGTPIRFDQHDPVPDAGQSSPLGATVRSGGVNFSLFSRSASGMELLLFDGEDDSRPARVIRIDPALNR